MFGSFSRGTYRAQALTINEAHVRVLFDQITPLRTVHSHRDTSDAGESADVLVSIDRGGVLDSPQFYLTRAVSSDKRLRTCSLPSLSPVTRCPYLLELQKLINFNI